MQLYTAEHAAIRGLLTLMYVSRSRDMINAMKRDTMTKN